MRSKPHQILIEDLLIWKEEKEVEYASSTKERKRLTCSLYGNYKVTVAGQVVYEGHSASLAVNTYNDIIEPYKIPTIHL